MFYKFFTNINENEYTHKLIFDFDNAMRHYYFSIYFYDSNFFKTKKIFHKTKLQRNRISSISFNFRSILANERRKYYDGLDSP